MAAKTVVDDIPPDRARIRENANPYNNGGIGRIAVSNFRSTFRQKMTLSGRRIHLDCVLPTSHKSPQETIDTTYVRVILLIFSRNTRLS